METETHLISAEHSRIHDRTQRRSHRRGISSAALSMCILGAIFYCYEYYLRVVPSVMSSELKNAFLLSDAAFGNLAACYYYAYTPMQIPVGMLLDRFGPRRTLTFACALCSLGTYMFVATQTLWVAQLGRFLVGFGSAFAYVGVLKISDVWLPKKYFALMAGIASALGMFGGISGELSMAFLVERVGWQDSIYWAFTIGVVLTVILFIVLRDDIQRSEVEKEKHIHEKPATILHGLLKISKNPQMWLNGFIGCLTFLPITAFAELWAIPFLSTVGFSKSGAALGSSMLFLGFALGGPFWGIISDKIQSRRIPLMLGSVLGAVFLFIAIKFPSTHVLWMYSLLLLASFASAAQILVFAVGNELNHSYVSATSVAFTNMVVMIGGMLPPFIGKLLDNSVRVVDGIPLYNIQDYEIALILIPICLAIAGVLSLALKETYRVH